jgi:hypothetical protein
VQTFNIEYNSIFELNNFLKKHKTLKDAKSILVQIFSGILHKNTLEEVSSSILKNLPNANIIGATTDGEIIENIVTTNKIILSFTIFEKSTIKNAKVDINNLVDSYSSGIEIVKKLKTNNTKVLILFADGLNINADELLKGVSSSISSDVIIAGGLSGDNATFKGTYIINQNSVFNKGVVGISINSDDLIINNGYSFAWQTIGKSFVVNRSKHNIVYEIDGMTPVELYKKYLGEDIANLLPGIGIEFPLIIQNEGFNIARAVLSANEDGSLVFAGNIKEGSIVKFGVGDANTIINDSINLSKNLSQIPCESIFIYSCMARRHFLDSSASSDIQYYSKIANTSGFFTYGEFYSNNKEANLLNESLTILAMSENKNIIKNSFEVSKGNSSSFTTLQALAHLTNVSSNELAELNESLEDKIKIEIEKNLENEKKLFNSMKMSSLGDMIANIAHQWRQPLSVISTIASSVQMSKEMGMINEERLSDDMSSILKQSQYLSETIDTFRDYIKEDYVLNDIEIHEELDKTIKLIEVVLKDNNINLFNNIDYKKPIHLKLISGELSQVIINIFNNAKDALILNKVEEKNIYIDLIIDNEYCIITIEDNAGGIPLHILPKIFEPYFTTKHKNNGTGIGLYMSYDIITKHFAGDLYAKNTKRGAKFYIKLPINK